MTYPSVEYGYAPVEAQKSRYVSFEVHAAEVLVVCAVLFFAIGLVGFFGQYFSSRPEPIYNGLLDGSMLATAADFVAVIVLLVAERSRKR